MLDSTIEICFDRATIVSQQPLRTCVIEPSLHENEFNLINNEIQNSSDASKRRT